MPGQGRESRRRRARRSPHDGTAGLSRVARRAGRSPACRRARPHRGGPPPRRSSATPVPRRSAPPGTGSWPPGWAPRPWRSARPAPPGSGVRPPWASPMRRSSATMASICSIGWAEKVRLARRGVGRRVLARQAALPDRRVGQRDDAELLAACRCSPTRSGMVRNSENSIWLLASRSPRLRSAASMARVSLAE